MDEKCQPRGLKVSAVSDVSLARDWADIIEEREAKRAGLDTVEEARPIVARKIGVPTSKLYSLRRKRLKAVASDIFAKIGGAVIRELQSELRQVEHDLQTRTQIGARPDSGETLSLLASRRKIREALGLIVAPDDGAQP